MKVRLGFDRTIDYRLEKKLPGRAYVIRLTALVQFKAKESTKWMDPYPAIVDTGAPNSMIPRRIWSNSDTRVLTEHEVRGIVPIDKCSLPVLVGEITIRLADEDTHTKAFRILSYLALTNKIPLILGFKDLLERFDISFNYGENKALIE